MVGGEGGRRQRRQQRRARVQRRRHATRVADLLVRGGGSVEKRHRRLGVIAVRRVGRRRRARRRAADLAELDLQVRARRERRARVVPVRGRRLGARVDRVGERALRGARRVERAVAGGDARDGGGPLVDLERGLQCRLAEREGARRVALQAGEARGEQPAARRRRRLGVAAAVHQRLREPEPLARRRPLAFVAQQRGELDAEHRLRPRRRLPPPRRRRAAAAAAAAAGAAAGAATSAAC